MNEIIKAELRVNGMPIDLNDFTEEFVGRTILGAVSCLKGAENLKTMTLSLDKRDLSIKANDNDIDLTDFPREVITNVVIALASSLKGVDEIERVELVARMS